MIRTCHCTFGNDSVDCLCNSICVSCACLPVVVSNTYCVVFLVLFVFVLYLVCPVASVSGLSFIDRPFARCPLLTASSVLSNVY